MRILSWCHELWKIWSARKKFQHSFGNQNSDFEKIDFIVHGLLQDQPLSSPAIALVKPQTLAATAGKQIITEMTPALLMPSQLLDQQPQSAAPTKTSNTTLFPDQVDKSDSKNPQDDQTKTTNYARIVREFHNLVVPKIEPADKVPIATLSEQNLKPKKPKIVRKMSTIRKSEHHSLHDRLLQGVLHVFGFQYFCLKT